MRVRRGAFDFLEHERARKRGALPGGQRNQRLLENRVKKVAETRETERRLTLRRLRLKHAESSRSRQIDALTPQRRLSHARLALEHERRCSVRETGNEVTQGRELGVPAHDDFSHRPIVRLLDTAFHGFRDLSSVRARVDATR
jgi:hypothetical protein